MTNVYFVRHATPNFANHDDRLRELTAQGLRDRERVTAFLWDKDIAAVFSSPYKRAVDTVAPFAEAKNLPLRLVEDFRERKVGSGWIEDFEGYSWQQWADFTYCLPDGESLQQVQDRNVGALRPLLTEWADKNIVIGSHGTALCTVLRYYDPAFGYPAFAAMQDRMPWIAVLSFEKDRCVGIGTHDLFA